MRFLGFALMCLIATEIHFPKEFQLLIVGLRYILLPIFFAVKIKKWSFKYFLALFYFSLVTLWSINNGYKPLILAMNLVASILYFLYAMTLDVVKFRSLGDGIQYGLGFLSVITIVIYVFKLDYILGIDCHSHRTGLLYDSKWDRYSLGNAIELSFMFVAMYLTSVKLRGHNPLLVFVMFLVCIISGSRLMILISSIITLQVFAKATTSRRLKFALTVAAMGSYVITYFQNSFLLVIERFSAWSEGSAEERSKLVDFVFDSRFLSRNDVLFFGDGYGSSYMFFSNVFRVHSTESVLLQILMETGIVGLILFISLFSGYLKKIRIGMSGLIETLILIQLMFFLPIFTYLTLIFFYIGLNINTGLNDYTQST